MKLKLKLQLMSGLVVGASVYTGVFLGSLKLIEPFFVESPQEVTEVLSPEQLMLSELTEPANLKF